jgi:hypothetical protein
MSKICPLFQIAHCEPHCREDCAWYNHAESQCIIFGLYNILHDIRIDIH